MLFSREELCTSELVLSLLHAVVVSEKLPTKEKLVKRKAVNMLTNFGLSKMQ